MKIKAIEISQYPERAIYRAHGKIFLIKRQLFTYDISSEIDLSYWIYERKNFLWWPYWSSLCQANYRVSKDTIEMAKLFLDTEYLAMSKVKYYSYYY